MSLNTEWRSRVESWITALEQLVYAPKGYVELEAFFTYDQLTSAEAADRDFAPIAAGTRWGSKWQYAWFRGDIRVPAEIAGETLVLHAGHPTPQFGGDIFGEWRVMIDGNEIGSRDWAHVHLRLPRKTDGQEYSFLAEAFGGPTRAGAGGGPALAGVPTLTEPPALQRVLPEVTFGVWREEVFQLAIDARTLLELRDQLPADSLRVAEIDAGLRDFTLIADPELTWPGMEPTVLAARERLRPLLECRNGSTAPTLFCVGHSHLDIVYQWPLKEAERKVARTFANQLGLMELYPEYKYLQSMPVLYDIAKRLHPTIYARVKDAVKRGQWTPEGGMWTEADVNLPGGESLVRQFLYGRRFFEEEFGVESEFVWLPDTFGFTGSLPQIMAGCGMTTFGSSKMFSVFGAEGEPFPYSTFWWEGIDGTRIFSHFVEFYGIRTNPAAIRQQWTQNPQKDGLRARMAVYGHSDGGGGCERTHLEFLRRQVDLEGSPRCRQAAPREFFDFQKRQPETLPVYTGEIYLPAHRGCYTTQAALKRGNRRCESMLREAELWATTAHVVAGAEYPYAALESAWKKTLFNQFHDILPGSCIERAANEANELYAEALAESTSLADAAMGRLATGGSRRFGVPSGEREMAGVRTGPDSPAQPSASTVAEREVVVFNSLPWARRGLVPVGEASVPDGALTQDISGVTHAEVRSSGCGWTGLAEACATDDVAAPRAKSAYDFENEFYHVRLDRSGRVTSWFDKESGRELAAGPLNEFRMYRDTPRVCDAWEIEAHYAQQPVALDDSAMVELLAAGPLAVVVRVRRTLHDSTMEQEIRLARGSRRLEFHTRIDWSEKHKLLKVCFPLAITTPEALHEIQFGHVKRPTHRSRKIDQDRFEVCQQKWSALAEEGRGAALLNDCKYGISAEGNTLGLTLLRAPQAPDMNADIGMHEFAYALYAWEGSLVESRVTQEALEFNAPLRLAEGSFAGGAVSLFECDCPNVILETVKLAEDRGGHVVLRLYEAARTTTRCRLRIGFSITRAHQTDMLERPEGELSVFADVVELDFRPFEIKTVRLTRG